MPPAALVCAAASGLAVGWPGRGSAGRVAALVGPGGTAGPRPRRPLEALLARPRDKGEQDARVVELLDGCVAELRAGATPVDAVERAAAGLAPSGLHDEVARVVETVRLGGSGPAALRTASDHVGAPALAWLAAGWELSESHGSALAPVAARVARAVRDQRSHALAVRAEVAGVRASVRVLAVLPLVGLLLGAAVGGGPFEVILTTPVGRTCAVLALLLETAGLRWTRALVRSALTAG